jgi:hypothetical protein
VGLGIVPGITMWAFFAIIGREEESSTEINESPQKNQRRERSKTSAYQ